ncbi:MAG: MotA/TolQ/ExbB proton channel family protein [Clostridia bacterium]|nr:MotA/TolQ/ExbB proton channel family protein [Clostridia bacterium]
MLTELMANLTANLVDFTIYGAIALVTITGFIKCIMPTRACGRSLRRGVRHLEMMTIKEGTRPVWQDTLFLGRRMQNAWRRFLVNAEQLDSRGINCDVVDYINDDTVIDENGHTQLAEVIPGILTSLGILGTFIGLVRGLGALDLSDAANTMSSISEMIGGMTFAFGTSIAGIACSLTFNILNRASVGSTQRAIDDFHEAFTEFVMQQPLSDNVQAICQQEDQAAFMRHAVKEISSRMGENVAGAVERSMMPVVQSLNQFVVRETQAQLEGLDMIVGNFVERMNDSLNGQLTRLGQTLTAINQSQQVDYNALNTSLDAANTIMQHLQGMGGAMQQVVQRLEAYVGEVGAVREEQEVFASRTQELLSSMHNAMDEQNQYLLALRAGHDNLQLSMQDYAQWSGRVLEAVHEQADVAAANSRDVAMSMRESGRQLSESYSSFVENIAKGLSRSMGMFEENMHAVVTLLDGRLEKIEKTAKATNAQYDARQDRLNESADGLITTLSRMQRALKDMTDAVESLTKGSQEA